MAYGSTENPVKLSPATEVINVNWSNAPKYVALRFAVHWTEEYGGPQTGTGPSAQDADIAGGEIWTSRLYFTNKASNGFYSTGYSTDDGVAWTTLSTASGDGGAEPTKDVIYYPDTPDMVDESHGAWALGYVYNSYGYGGFYSDPLPRAPKPQSSGLSQFTDPAAGAMYWLGSSLRPFMDTTTLAGDSYGDDFTDVFYTNVFNGNAVNAIDPGNRVAQQPHAFDLSGLSAILNGKSYSAVALSWSGNPFSTPDNEVYDTHIFEQDMTIYVLFRKD